MAMTQRNCIIWETPVTYHLDAARGGYVVDSPRTDGRYFVRQDSTQVEQAVRPLTTRDKACLTTWLIDQRRLGVDAPELTTGIVTQCRDGRSRSVHDRAYRLLRYLARKTDTIGAPVSAFNFLDEDGQASDYWPFMAWSESTTVEEVQFLIRFLLKEGMIETETETVADYQSYFVTPEGFGRIEKLDSVRIKSEQAFVAMWFADEMRAVFDKGIEPALAASGYKALRIDRKDHNNKIDDEIVAEIRRSRFVVADFTYGTSGPRGGVYFEAGFAQGLGIPVVFSCRQDLLDEGKIHFDTRQYNHIGWTTDRLDEFKDRLSQRISATLGDGPLKQLVPSVR
ncbi:MAG: hypothetical protein ABL957_12980 [Parvularculaceae bacterium]